MNSFKLRISFPPGMFDKYKDEIEDLRRSRTSLHQIGQPEHHAKVCVLWVNMKWTRTIFLDEYTVFYPHEHTHYPSKHTLLSIIFSLIHDDFIISFITYQLTQVANIYLDIFSFHLLYIYPSFLLLLLPIFYHFVPELFSLTWVIHFYLNKSWR